MATAVKPLLIVSEPSDLSRILVRQGSSPPTGAVTATFYRASNGVAVASGTPIGSGSIASGDFPANTAKALVFDSDSVRLNLVPGDVLGVVFSDAAALDGIEGLIIQIELIKKGSAIRTASGGLQFLKT